MNELFERFGQAFPAGTVLFREGEPGDVMYVVQSGRVELTRLLRGRQEHLATLPAGEFFGEMAIINQRPRTATAQVIEDALLLVIDRRTFEAMVRGNTEIAVRLIKKLAARLDQANQQVETLLIRELNHRVVAHLRSLASAVTDPADPTFQVGISVDDIAIALDATIPEVEGCLTRLAEARLIYRDDRGAIHVPEAGKLDAFLEFLDMKERFG